MSAVSRRYTYSRTLVGGCFECNGSDGLWFSGNAQAVAARHHDATGHITWVDVTLSIKYGDSLKSEPKRTAASLRAALGDGQKGGG